MCTSLKNEWSASAAARADSIADPAIPDFEPESASPAQLNNGGEKGHQDETRHGQLDGSAQRTLTQGVPE